MKGRKPNCKIEGTNKQPANWTTTMLSVKDKLYLSKSGLGKILLKVSYLKYLFRSIFSPTHLSKSSLPTTLIHCCRNNSTRAKRRNESYALLFFWEYDIFYYSGLLRVSVHMFGQKTHTMYCNFGKKNIYILSLLKLELLSKARFPISISIYIHRNNECAYVLINSGHLPRGTQIVL